MSVCTFTRGRSPHGITYDGSAVWVTDYGGGRLIRVNQYQTATPQTDRVDLVHPLGIVFDGCNIRFADQAGSTLTRLVR